MAISRVPGYSLLANLDRQGTDLSLTSNGQTLAYFDVTNYRLGINTGTSTLPSDVLEVNGNILVSNGNIYSSGNLTANLGAPSRYWRAVYAGNFIGNISLTSGLSSDITSAISTANLALQSYVDSQVSAANIAWQSNASAQQSLLSTLLANAATQSDLIIGINANITAANTGMKGYVDNTVSTANTGMRGYVDSTISANVTAANVAWQANASAQQSLIYALQSNAATQSDLIIGINANVTAANTGMKGYVDNTVSTANTGMRGYVDAVSTAWAANAYQQQQILGNIIATAYSNANVSAYMVSYNGNIAASNITVSNFANIISGTPSTSTTTGALILTGSGGAGIGGNLNVGGNVSASYLTATNGIFGTIITATQTNITSVGTLTNLAVAGNVDTNILNANRIFYANNEVLTTATAFNFTGDITAIGSNANVYVTFVSTGVSPGIYGSGTGIPVLTIDAKGRITSATSVSPTFTGNLNFANTTISTGVGNITLTTTNGGNIVLNATGQGVVQIQGNDAVGLPSGNTASRPTSPLVGYFRFNTDDNNVEFYDGTGWASPASNIANTISSQILPTDGINDTFPLSTETTSESVLVIINGTIQQPNVAYVVNGANITLSEIPNTTDTVEVRQIAQGTAAVTALNLGTSAGVTLSTGNLNIKGNLIPTTSLLYDIGSNTYRWRDLYLSGSSIKLGNVTLKESNGNLRLRNADDTADAFLEATSTSSATFESLSKNISSYPFAINRTGDIITSVEYTTPSGVITKAFTYIDGQIAQIDISGIPLGASIYTKTLSYVNGVIQGASYSTA